MAINEWVKIMNDLKRDPGDGPMNDNYNGNGPIINNCNGNVKDNDDTPMN